MVLRRVHSTLGGFDLGSPLVPRPIVKRVLPHSVLVFDLLDSF